MNNQEKTAPFKELETMIPLTEKDVFDELRRRNLKNLKAIDTDKLLRMKDCIEREQSKNSEIQKKISDAEYEIIKEISDVKYSLDLELFRKVESLKELYEKSFLEKILPIITLITAVISVILLVINIASH